MNGVWVILIAACLMMASGLPAVLGQRRSRTAQRLAAALLIAGSLTGLAGLAVAIVAGSSGIRSLPWQLPWGSFAIEVDALSAVFLIPVLTVPALGAIYGLDYWKQAQHPENGRGLSLFYGLLAGSMVMVVIARDSVLFMISWEVMALSAFFLATTENEKPEVRRAGWIYLVATHAGTVCLLALFALLRSVSGDSALAVLDAGSLSTGMAGVLFVLALVGFGFKAGIMPMHLWLPGAHANAPSHVSAVMSGVMLKMGIYGMIRIFSLLPAPELWNGGVLLSLGAITGILGIAFAIGQNDIKRLLAYSSIENIGIIIMGLGLALIGRTLHRNDLVLLGFGGALLHVWNHSLFKSLLFLNTGAIIHATHTRDMNRMGGLAASMPQTAGLFILGAVAICGLPPLNGFAGEWMLYMGFFRSLAPAGGVAVPAAAIGAIALALIGALALACFVKIHSSVFLGVARHAIPPEGRHDPHPLMRYPMLLLAAACVVLGILPQVGLPLIRRAATALTGPLLPGELPLLSLAPIHRIGIASLLLVLVSAAAIGMLRARIRRQPAALPVGTWGCGYARAQPRMQYTATSFAEMLVKLFAWALRPLTRRPDTTALFPSPEAFSMEVHDPVLTRLALPVFRHIGRQMTKLRLIQQGRTEFYLLYILFMILFLLCWNHFAIGR